MRLINPLRAGLAVGVVIGMWHLGWAVLVALGWAKPIMDFILKLHFIRLQYDLAPFALSTAAMLVGVTFCVGALFGMIFALVWNWIAAGAAEAKDLGGEPARV